jgi:hypothetical protein
MAKYYVESGSFRGIVASKNAETAAVWAIQRVMAPQSSLDNREDEGLFRLQDEIGVSERGFGRRDATRILTRDAFLHWAQMSYDSGCAGL